MKTYGIYLAFTLVLGTGMFLHPMLIIVQGQDLPEITFEGQTLQVLPADYETAVPWGREFITAEATSVINGKANTSAIVNRYGNWNNGLYAAKLCQELTEHGYDDWYLPSATELAYIWEKRDEIGGFLPMSSYWSSTEEQWGNEAAAMDFSSGLIFDRYKYELNRVRCVRRKKVEGALSKNVLEPVQEEVLVASRYALKSDGTKGLLFGARLLSFFTIAATSIIQEATYSAIIQRIAEETAVEALKDLGKQVLLSSLPGIDGSNIRYISYAFPIKPGKQVQAEDVIVLLEMADYRNLVPLNVPVVLHYKPIIMNPGEPTVAMKHGYDIQFDSQAGYSALSLSTLWNHFRPTNFSSSDFRFQTFGVVDGYYTPKLSGGRELTFMILKQYDNYDFAFMQTTDIVFIAVDVTNLQQYPVPGSVIHLWGESVGLGGFNLIDLSYYSSERTSVSRYVRMDGHKLLTGIYAPANQVEQGRSVFSVNSDPHHWDAVVVDLYHEEYYGWDKDQSDPSTELSEYLIGTWGPSADDGIAPAEYWVFEEENMFSIVIEGKVIGPNVNQGQNYRELIEDFGYHSIFHQRYSLDESKRPIKLDFILYGQKGEHVNELERFKNIMRVLDDGTIELRVSFDDDHYDSFDSNCYSTIFLKKMNDDLTVLEPMPAGGVSGQSGNFTDPRDGQSYRWVQIGDQVWMAENLNYATGSGSWCYDDQTINCQNYGRLYNWKTARRVCPSGWHLPSDAEWTQLTNYASDSVKKFKAKSGWNDGRNGVDDYGFSALPGGGRWLGGGFDYLGESSYWWSVTDYMKNIARIRAMRRNSDELKRDFGNKKWGLSVRCLKDNVPTEDD